MINYLKLTKNNKGVLRTEPDTVSGGRRLRKVVFIIILMPDVLALRFTALIEIIWCD